MNKICTSIEQSKKLMELGIDVNTADMRYGYIAPYDYSDRMFDGGYDEVPYPKDFLKRNPNFSENEYDGELPAWSVSTLLKLIPNWQMQTQDNGIGILFGCKECIKIIDADTPLDACYEMVCWLKENGKI